MNDLIQVVKILELDEVEELNSYVDTLELGACNVFDSETGEMKVSNIRTSTGAELDNLNVVTQKLHSALNRGLDEYKNRISKICDNFNYYPVPGGYSTKSWREAIQVLEYQPSQEYKMHHDEADDRPREEYHRKISIITYLTEGFVGGGTEFPHITFKPKPGYALIFPSNWCYPHAGEPVTSGTKRVAVTWYYVEQT